MNAQKRLVVWHNVCAHLLCLSTPRATLTPTWEQCPTKPTLATNPTQASAVLSLTPVMDSIGSIGTKYCGQYITYGERLANLYLIYIATISSVSSVPLRAKKLKCFTLGKASLKVESWA
jgi:hypothetical protein